MSAFLTAEWFAEASAALRAVALSNVAAAVVEYSVSGGPDGKVTFHALLEEGVVVGLELGKAPAADIVLSCSYDTALAVIRAEQDADEAFMTGALKVEGDHARWLLDLRAARAAAVEVLAPITDT